MNGHKNPDYLSLLPPELLDDIFTLANGSAAIVKAPLSRALQLHVERAFYGELCFHSSHRFERFCESANPAKMLLVKSIVIDRSLVMDFDAEEEDFDPTVLKEERDWGLVEVAGLVRGFQHLQRLEHLAIKGWTRLVLIVLSSSVAASSLPSLKSLKLESTFVDIQDPFHPSHYSNLQSYPQLASFDLSVMRAPSSIESSAKSIPSPYFSLVSLRSLRIHGPISCSTHDSSLLSCFPSLENVSLDDDSSTASVLGLVDSLPDPPRLQTLWINFRRPRGERITPVSPIDFAQFANLRSLTLGGLVTLEAPEFYEVLRNLPLRHLALDYGTKLFASGLKDLVEDSLQQHIKSLTLGNIFAYVDYDTDPLDFLSYSLTDEDEETAHLELRLLGPHWTEHFSKEGFLELLRIAEDKGVRIQGRTLDALRLEEKFESGEVERERVNAREKRAKEKARRELVDGDA